jgi:hypothetical protein
MSEDELNLALTLLQQNERRRRLLINLYRPRTPALNPETLTPQFKRYYEERYKTDMGKREQRVYELVFEKMILGARDLDEVEAEHRRLYNEEPPIGVKSARYSERAKRIFAEFWVWRKSNSE